MFYSSSGNSVIITKKYNFKATATFEQMKERVEYDFEDNKDPRMILYEGWAVLEKAGVKNASIVYIGYDTVTDQEIWRFEFKM